VLHKNEAGVTVHAAEGIVLPLPGQTGGIEGQRVVYGVRPEHLQVDGNGGVPCCVGVVEPTGASTYVYAQMAGAEICGVFTERHTFTPGEAIRLQPMVDRVHLFDQASGQAIAISRELTRA
jgi:multiple sugar transport system ATP-binding protein